MAGGFATFRLRLGPFIFIKNVMLRPGTAFFRTFVVRGLKKPLFRLISLPTFTFD